MATAALGILALAMLYTVAGTAQDMPSRQSFQIATGPSGGTYFPIGQAIAEIVSHPPGAARCDGMDVCGPLGLIATSRTSAGAVSNVLDVNAHRVDAALAQSDVVAESIAGKGAFSRVGPQRHIRTLAVLFPEQVLIVVSKSSHIRKLADLKGRRISLGPSGSGTSVTARAVLTAAHLVNRVRVSDESADRSVALLEQGKIDAFFFVGGSPVPFVRDLVGRGKAILVGIDGASRKKLMTDSAGLESATIPADAYGGQGQVETVSARATLIVSDQESSEIVAGVLRALFNPANRGLLEASHEVARQIRLETATKNLAAPLHAAAARYYAEVGISARSTDPTR